MVRSLATGITLGLTKSLYLDLTLYFRCRRRLPVVCKHKQGVLIQDHLSSRLEVQVPSHCHLLHAHRLLTTTYSHSQSTKHKKVETQDGVYSVEICVYIYSIFMAFISEIIVCRIIKSNLELRDERNGMLKSQLTDGPAFACSGVQGLQPLLYLLVVYVHSNTLYCMLIRDNGVRKRKLRLLRHAQRQTLHTRE